MNEIEALLIARMLGGGRSGANVKMEDNPIRGVDLTVDDALRTLVAQNYLDQFAMLRLTGNKTIVEFLTPADLEPIEEHIRELELYKTPNATIVGDPTINNGQISNFSTSNYLKFPFLVNFGENAFEINMEFTTGSNVTNQENIFDSDYGLAFAIRNGKFVIAISTNGTSWDLGESVGSHTITPNTTYYVKLSWNKLVYKLSYSLDGGTTYIDDITKTAAVSPYPKQIYIGVGENFATVSNFFGGIINLNRANVYINGKLHWQGMDDVGLETRLDTSLSNVDDSGIIIIKNLAENVCLSYDGEQELTDAQKQMAQRNLGIYSAEGVEF